MPPTESSPTKGDIQYLSLEQVLAAHAVLIKRYGGSQGIFNQGLLESAVFRPQATAFGQEAYPTLFEKCACIGYSLIQNHPFIDGNKRTGFAAMHLMLLINGYDLDSTPLDSKHLTGSTAGQEIAMTENIASGKMREPEIVQWLKQHSKKKTLKAKEKEK